MEDGVLEDRNILSGDITVLSEYRGLVKEHNDAKAALSETAAKEKELERDAALRRKNLKDTIDSTLKKRRGEVCEDFDKEIDAASDKLKKIRAKRGKAKDKGVKERIAEETADLVAQNKVLKKNISAALKEEKLPSFCGSGFYFTLYFTKGAGEIFLCALVILLAFLILPAVVYLVLPFKELKADYPVPVVAVTYFVIIVIFFFIYKIIGDKTKHRHRDALKSIRELRDSITGNNRQISNISRSIKRDKNEEMYNLEDFDSQISQLEAQIAGITEEKEAALSNFDNNSSQAIKAEIEGRELPKIEEVEEELRGVSAKKAELEEEVRQRGLKLSTEYEAYLGKDYNDIKRLNGLFEIMETGQAATIGEAINIDKSR